MDKFMFRKRKALSSELCDSLIEFYEESHESEDNSLSQVFECETTDLICSSDQIQQQLTKFPSRLN